MATQMTIPSLFNSSTVLAASRAPSSLSVRSFVSGLKERQDGLYTNKDIHQFFIFTSSRQRVPPRDDVVPSRHERATHSLATREESTVVTRPPNRSVSCPTRHLANNTPDQSLSTDLRVPQLEPSICRDTVDTRSIRRLFFATHSFKAAFMASTNSSAASRYHHVHHEGDVKSLVSLLQSGKRDGHWMYRALARQVIGDPSKHRHIHDAVLHFAIRVRSNPSYPLHLSYLEREASFRQQIGMDVFTVLDCPDLVPANPHLCWIVASALKMQVRIYASITRDGELRELRGVAGSSTARTSHALLQTPASGPLAVRYSALLLDESGKALLEHLETTTKRIKTQPRFAVSNRSFAGLQMQQISWSLQKVIPQKGAPEMSPQTTIKCFNGFRAHSKPEDVSAPKDFCRMDTFVTVVNDPLHVKPALEIFLKSVELAPNHKRDVKVSSSGKPGKTLPHVAADAEFVILPKDLVDGTSKDQQNQMIADGKVEELSSVLTLSVGKNCSLVVNILHMLENANEHTVPALELLLKKTIFNAKIMKLWWNLQSDFFVLENTIAHMYQGTKREPFLYRPHRCQNLSPRTITPTFRVKNQYLNGERPKHMIFPKGDRKDRLYPILEHMKDQAPYGQLAKDRFYQSLGDPGMELNDGVMAYLTGNCYGVNMIFEQLFARDDLHFVASQVYSWAHAEFAPEFMKKALPQGPQDIPGSRSIGNLPLFDDYPKTFKREAFCKEYAHLRGYDVREMDDSVVASAFLAPWQHDERVKINRSLVKSGKLSRAAPSKSIYAPLEEDDQKGVDQHKAALLQQTMDPMALWVPATCARIFQEDYPDPIVRAGTTYAEALIEFLQFSRCKDATPPPGFGAAVGSEHGLPSWLGRVRGAGLSNARNIYEAFQVKTGSGALLGELSTTYHPPPIIDSAKPNYAALVRQALDEQKRQGIEKVAVQAEQVRDILLKNIATEVELNANQGLPSLTRLTDLMDPEGREYRQRVEATPEWNRPDLQFTPTVKVDGAWKSVATEMLAALDAMEIPPVEQEKEETGEKEQPVPTRSWAEVARGSKVEATPAWNRPSLPPFPAAEEDGRWMSKATEMLDVLPKGLFAFGRGYQAAGQAGRPFRPPYSYAKVSNKEWDAESKEVRRVSSPGEM
ncbi:hypothetical protein M409DRAFT_52987 [Zasmidium cellare ATCC 36951]|uniref:Uncharacterized protein n=1 Tax=Zasmidium cellare ATCC 36951 TaxID=1080233 RepID=A0A6A6CPI6_ZASCE|nr:uncharacterized protein M409DRAFT_52987 [Zasmidium cellare ATCC 36951]KAF2169015.1 hypothetical protein M409DRAFT_52987 [Zasmidium cellare ATCC 36951]